MMPIEVANAVDTIVNYLREGCWTEVVISEGGGAAFHVETMYDWLSDEGCRKYGREQGAIRWEAKATCEETYIISRVGDVWCVKDRRGEILASCDTRREAELFVSALHEWESWVLLYVHVMKGAVEHD